MKALISNDDGVNATGILAAKNAIEDLCEVCVVAPETQQSGIGHAITLYDPLRINPTTLRDKSQAYGVTGTPTDAVTFGLFEIMGEKPDIMISGINTGFNIGVYILFPSFATSNSSSTGFSGIFTFNKSMPSGNPFFNTIFTSFLSILPAKLKSISTVPFSNLI